MREQINLAELLEQCYSQSPKINFCSFNKLFEKTEIQQFLDVIILPLNLWFIFSRCDNLRLPSHYKSSSLLLLSSFVCDIIFQRSLDEHSIEVVVVSFGCLEGASHWLRETGCQYDMLLDPDRKVRGQRRRTIIPNTHFRLFLMVS